MILFSRTLAIVKDIFTTKNFLTKQIIISFSLLPIIICAQSNMPKDSVEYTLQNSPSFSIFKDNYFLMGTSLNEKPNKNNSDGKFQFSFKQRLSNKPLLWGSYVYLTYTQKSFWYMYKNSGPISETNYNPGVQLLKPFYSYDQLKSLLTFSIEHESNGRDGINSRGWSYVGILYNYFFSDKLNASFKLMLPFDLEQNKDLNKYIGYSEAQLSWNIINEKLILDIIGRKGASWDSKGSLMTTLSFRPFKKGNMYLTLQGWQGYGESLLDYKKSASMIRIGVMIKPSFLKKKF